MSYQEHKDDCKCCDCRIRKILEEEQPDEDQLSPYDRLLKKYRQSLERNAALEKERNYLKYKSDAAEKYIVALQFGPTREDVKYCGDKWVDALNKVEL